MATYNKIQEWVRIRHGFVPKTCWIAHCKELNGLAPRRSPNRQGLRRLVPCPPEKRAAIEDALRYFGMI